MPSPTTLGAGRDPPPSPNTPPSPPPSPTLQWTPWWMWMIMLTMPKVAMTTTTELLRSPLETDTTLAYHYLLLYCFTVQPSRVIITFSANWRQHNSTREEVPLKDKSVSRKLPSLLWCQNFSHRACKWILNLNLWFVLFWPYLTNMVSFSEDKLN